MDSQAPTSLFRHEPKRWILLAGALTGLGLTSFLVYAATQPVSWRSVSTFGPFAFLLLLVSYNLSVLFRNPRRYTLEVTSHGISQPYDPARPALAWTGVTCLTHCFWGGFRLSDADDRHRVRVWGDVSRFHELLDLILSRADMSPPPLPIVLIAPRRQQMEFWGGLACWFAMLGWIVATRGPGHLLLATAAVLAWVSYVAWSRHRAAATRVEIGPEAVRVSSPAGDTVTSWNQVIDVRFIAARSRAPLAILLRADGAAVEIPALGISSNEAYRVYHALRVRCDEGHATSSLGEGLTGLPRQP